MKSLVKIIMLIALIGGAYFLYQNKSQGGQAERDYKDFAIEDTSTVDKIFLSQPNGKKLLLIKKENNVWYTKNGFKARKDAIDIILKTANDIQVRSSVSKKTFTGVVKRLATGSTKVEFYQKGNTSPTKVWYVGDATANRLGTYMLLEKQGVKSSQPYAMHMVMERGYLGSRFFLDPLLWRERDMLKCNPQTIQSITVKHRSDTMTSFVISKSQENKFTLVTEQNKQEINIPQELGVGYFKLFSGVFYEYIDVKSPKELLDSIYQSIPRHEITIKFEDEKTVDFKTYDMNVKAGSILNGKEINYHPERMYAYSSKLGKDVKCIVQNLTFDPLVNDLQPFISSTTVEK